MPGAPVRPLHVTVTFLIVRSRISPTLEPPVRGSCLRTAIRDHWKKVVNLTHSKAEPGANQSLVVHKVGEKLGVRNAQTRSNV
jgi:hypothetical protein